MKGSSREAAFDEEFYMVIDDLETQMMTIKVGVRHLSRCWTLYDVS